jgi:hypothetical protein
MRTQKRALTPCLAPLVLATVLLSCDGGPSEPLKQTRERSGDLPAEVHHDSHRIIEADHRHILHLRTDDRVLAPNDPAFDWHIALEDPSAFARVSGDESAPEVYRLTKAGPYRIMVYGDPKCLKSDAACTLSKRRWDVTVDVR